MVTRISPGNVLLSLNEVAHGNCYAIKAVACAYVPIMFLNNIK